MEAEVKHAIPLYILPVPTACQLLFYHNNTLAMQIDLHSNFFIPRRNNEKRKEKSRDAARCRRSRECEIFTELGETLPVRNDELENLDKASVMRLAIATLKIEDMMKLCEYLFI